MNSSNTITAPPRRFKWLRRLFWAAVCLVSLITALWQWENWRSARELKAAHARLIERIGTDDPLAYAPPKIPDTQNFFALPVIEQWATEPLEHGSRFKRYKIPEHVFLPRGTASQELNAHLADDSLLLEITMKNAVELDRILGDANGLLPQFTRGLSLPTSFIKPGLAEILETAGDRDLSLVLPNVGLIHHQVKDLGLHLRAAAYAGNDTKTQSIALILLRLFPESFANHGTLISSISSIGFHLEAFEALQDALAHPVWTEESLRQLQIQLQKHNDLEVTAAAWTHDMLWMHANIMRMRQAQISGKGDTLIEACYSSGSGRQSGSLAHWLHQKTIRALGLCVPIGWTDANAANYLDRMLDIIGPNPETEWREAASSLAAEKRRNKLVPGSNPRRMLANVAIPDVGSVYVSAAEALFHRRCLILACELEKHRLTHGSYPVQLPVMKGDELSDLARPGHLPNYRLEKNGYLLWSAGPDAKDDGGIEEKDWLWKMRRG